MNQPMGQVAYEALQQYLATNVPDEGLPSEEWSELPPLYREAWEAGAQAVLAAYAPQHVQPKDATAAYASLDMHPLARYDR